MLALPDEIGANALGKLIAGVLNLTLELVFAFLEVAVWLVGATIVLIGNLLEKSDSRQE
jgi:hypothetical protein